MEAVIWLDKNGEPTDAAHAVTGEIHTNDQRTYVDLRTQLVEEHDDIAQSGSQVSVSEAIDPANTDMLKASTWDIYGEDQQPVTNLLGLLSALGWDGLPQAEARTAVCSLLELPAWEPAPDELKQDVYDWLVATRQE